jgi:transposase
MDDKQLYSQLLGLSSPWQVCAVTLNVEQEQVDVFVGIEEGASVCCPECGQECSGYDAREERRWRHLDSCGFLTYLVARVPRVRCRVHGVMSMSVPWSEPHSRFTLAFSWFALRVLQATKVQGQAASLLRLSPGQIHDLMHRAVERGLERREAVRVPHLGIDEKSIARGHSYAVILSDTQQGRVLEVEAERTKEAARSLFNVLSEEQKSAVESVSMDMWPAFLSAREEVLPQAATVHDRFHIAQYLAEAVDKTRRREQRRFSKTQQNSTHSPNPVAETAVAESAVAETAVAEKKGAVTSPLSKTKYLWLKNPLNLTAHQQEQLDALLHCDLETGRVWALKENFRHFFECASLEEGQLFFDNWQKQVEELANPHLTKVAQMLQKHQAGLLAYLQHHTNNATAEGLNGQIQLLKASARGYRQFKNFRIAILFFLGKLDLNPHTSP